MRSLLLAGAAFAMSSAACGHGASQLHDPVGETMGAAPPPTQAPVSASDATTSTTTTDADPHPASESSPCGTEPPIVQFNGSSTDIDEEQARELRGLASCLADPPHEKTNVVLVGYTDLIGTVASNLELGMARAQAVMRHLVAAGVAPGRIVVASAGELQRPHARLGMHAPRVEVLLARGGLTRPNEAPIARGIEAEGLMPRPRATAQSPAAPPPRPATPAQPVRRK